MLWYKAPTILFFVRSLVTDPRGKIKKLSKTMKSFPASAKNFVATPVEKKPQAHQITLPFSFSGSSDLGFKNNFQS